MPPPPASFQFIDQSSIDRKVRRNIRSHVMRGKNVGKVRPPRKQPTTLGATDAQSLSLQREITFSEAKSSPKLLIQLGSELSGVRTPCNISTHSRRFLHDCLFLHTVLLLGIIQTCSHRQTFIIVMCYIADSVYPSQFCHEPYTMVQTIWLRNMFLDEGCKCPPL